MLGKGVNIMNKIKVEHDPTKEPKNENIRAPIPVRGGLSRSEIKEVKTRIDATGKCCEGGSEGWTG